MVFVVGKTGELLMPTSEYKARRLLKKKRAVIYKYRPFAIRLLDRKTGERQPVEYTSDVGYKEVGITIKSEKHSCQEVQADLLPDEKERHKDQKTCRRARQNRKRYRKPRFDNRKKPKGWLAPSVRHKMEAQVRLFQDYLSVCPITSAYFEMGKFDTQVLKAVEAGKPVPEGADHQHGERYGFDTLRKAVFARDNYTCVICERKIKDKAIFHTHHIGYWRGDRSDRMSNLATVCEQCHTPPNHQPGGKLYGMEPELKSFAGATFMTMIRSQMLGELKKLFPEVHITYGLITQRNREAQNLPKSHINDAYCIGEFRPRHRTHPIHIAKERRNDRCLQKFYDAKYIDSRDGKEKKGKDLFNGRINRNHKKDSENLHPYREKKTKKGYFSIRKSRTQIKPGSIVLYQNEKKTVHGTHTRYYKPKKSPVPVKHINVEFITPASDGKRSADLTKCIVLGKEFLRGWKQVVD